VRVASVSEFRLIALLRRLAAAQIDFVVIGGVAVSFQGYGRSTKDLDITYATDAENLERLSDVLLSLHARLRGVADGVPYVPDARTLRRVQLLTLDTDEGGLDLLVDPDGAAPYAELRARADRVELEDVEIRVVALEDLLAMKRAAARPQDLVDVEALEAARRLRDEGVR
jgi:predicted nucleotidyltransferase